MAQNQYLVNSTDMTTVADAIRAKGGTSAPLAFPDGFAAAIEAIQSGGADLFGVISIGAALYPVSGMAVAESGAAIVLS